MKKYFGVIAIILLSGALFIKHTYVILFGVVFGALLAVLAPRGNSKIIAFIILVFCLLKVLFYILFAIYVVGNLGRE